MMIALYFEESKVQKNHKRGRNNGSGFFGQPGCVVFKLQPSSFTLFRFQSCPVFYFEGYLSGYGTTGESRFSKGFPINELY